MATNAGTQSKLTYNEVIELFKRAARWQAVEVAESRYEATHTYCLETAFYANNREAYDAIRIELPRDLFDNCDERGILKFLNTGFDVNVDVDLDEDGDEDSGLAAEEVEALAKEWVGYELEDLTWVEELASDDLIYHIPGSEKTITHDDLKQAVDELVDYLIDTENSGKSVALFVFEDGSCDIQNPAHPFAEKYIVSEKFDVGEIWDFDEDALFDWARQFPREDVVNDLAGMLQIGREE